MFKLILILGLGDFLTASPGKKIVNVKRRVFGDGLTTQDAKSAIDAEQNRVASAEKSMHQNLPQAGRN